MVWKLQLSESACLVFKNVSFANSGSLQNPLVLSTRKNTADFNILSKHALTSLRQGAQGAPRGGGPHCFQNPSFVKRARKHDSRKWSALPPTRFQNPTSVKLASSSVKLICEACKIICECLENMIAASGPYCTPKLVTSEVGKSLSGSVISVD